MFVVFKEVNKREINIGAHLPQMIPDDFQQFMPLRYEKSTKTSFKMLRKSWAA